MNEDVFVLGRPGPGVEDSPERVLPGGAPPVHLQSLAHRVQDVRNYGEVPEVDEPKSRLRRLHRTRQEEPRAQGRLWAAVGLQELVDAEEGSGDPLNDSGAVGVVDPRLGLYAHQPPLEVAPEEPSDRLDVVGAQDPPEAVLELEAGGAGRPGGLNHCPDDKGARGRPYPQVFR